MSLVRSKLLVLSSTYPRWTGDHEPGFVHELSKRLTDDFDIHVLCPHSPNTKKREHMDGITVHRFQYAPTPLETLVSDGGIMNNLKHHHWKWLLLPTFFLSMIWNTVRLIRQLNPDAIHAHWLIPQGLAHL